MTTQIETLENSIKNATIRDIQENSVRALGSLKALQTCIESGLVEHDIDGYWLTKEGLKIGCKLVLGRGLTPSNI